jgi:thymidylate synthase (FAD)
MKLIKPSIEILETSNVLKSIELAARTCYQSQDKITEDDTSAKKLVKSLIERKHYAMLEFGDNLSFYIEERDMMNIIKTICHLPAFGSMKMTFQDEVYAVSFNPRTAIEILNYIEPINYNPSVQNFFNSIYDNLHEDLRGLRERKERNYIKLENYDFDIIDSLNRHDKPYHKTVTVKLITNRGVTHEIVRHRKNSFGQESTRYVDGIKNMSFIEPIWYNEKTSGHDCFNSFLQNVEVTYETLRENGWQKQEAREVLPNSLKTEIVIKATINEWKHIFELRCAKDAHPEMIRIMELVRDEFFEREFI